MTAANPGPKTPIDVRCREMRGREYRTEGGFKERVRAIMAAWRNDESWKTFARNAGNGSSAHDCQMSVRFSKSTTNLRNFIRFRFSRISMLLSTKTSSRPFGMRFKSPVTPEFIALVPDDESYIHQLPTAWNSSCR